MPIAGKSLLPKASGHGTGDAFDETTNSQNATGLFDVFDGKGLVGAVEADLATASRLVSSASADDNLDFRAVADATASAGPIANGNARDHQSIEDIGTNGLYSAVLPTLLDGLINSLLLQNDQTGNSATAITKAESPDLDGTASVASTTVTAGTTAPAVTVVEGATVEIDGVGTQSVTFTGTTGTLKIDHSTAFTGQVSGLTGSDVLDLVDVSYGAATHATFSGNQAVVRSRSPTGLTPPASPYGVTTCCQAGICPAMAMEVRSSLIRWFGRMRRTPAYLLALHSPHTTAVWSSQRQGRSSKALILPAV